MFQWILEVELIGGVPLKEQLGVFSSDGINLYGFRFTVGALVDILEKNWLDGNPSILGHDIQRPIGWSYPLAIHIEPGLARLLGLSQTIETDEEAKHLYQRLNQYIYRKAVVEHCEEIEQLKTILSEHLQGNEEIHAYREAVTLVEPNLARRVFPSVFSEMDKDGLVPLDMLSSIGPGVFRINDLLLFVHPFFRRSCSRINTLNTAFLRQLQLLANQKFSPRIALDVDSVGLASTYHESEELEYWWGPKFHDDLVSIPAGVTHHENSELESLMHGIKSTQFSWQSREGQHIFEAEELLGVPDHSNSDGFWGCRYVHSIIQEQTGRIEHLDGAIRGYSKQHMDDRLAVDISHAGRNSQYVKLWRVDGVIPIAKWKRLISDYYRDNHLIGEYFGAPVDDLKPLTIKTHTESEPAFSLRQMVPYTMNAGDGIRVSLSFHPFKHTINTRSVICMDTLTLDGQSLSVVDAVTIELKKALQRLGASLSIDPSIQFIKYKDIYSYFPLILHTGDSLSEELSVTLEAYRNLLAAWKRKKVDRVVSFSIGFPTNGNEFRVSVLGHIEDLNEWLSNTLSSPPISPELIRDWADSVSEMLGKRYPTAGDRPAIFDTLMPSGIFVIQRKPITEMAYAVNYSEERRAFFYQFKPSEGHDELIEALNGGVISPAPAIIVAKSECEKCRLPYKDCLCSSLLDDDVAERIIKAEVKFLFWTDRPVWPWQPSMVRGENDSTDR